MPYRSAFSRSGRYPIGQRGFTLIEALVALALVGILASIAYPSYTQYVERSVLSDGKTGLMKAASTLEHCYTKTYSYSDSSCEPIESESPAGHYTIKEVTGDGGYTLTATLQDSSSSDSCNPLTLNAKGEKTPEECW